MTTQRPRRTPAQTPRRLIRGTVIACALSFATESAAQQNASAAGNIRDFDAYVAKAMKDWKVPGLAIAIVRNDSVVFAKGYGVRKLGEPTQVDPRTVFATDAACKRRRARIVLELARLNTSNVGRICKRFRRKFLSTRKSTWWNVG